MTRRRRGTRLCHFVNRRWRCRREKFRRLLRRRGKRGRENPRSSKRPYFLGSVAPYAGATGREEEREGARSRKSAGAETNEETRFTRAAGNFTRRVRRPGETEEMGDPVPPPLNIGLRCSRLIRFDSPFDTARFCTTARGSSSPRPSDYRRTRSRPPLHRRRRRAA